MGRLNVMVIDPLGKGEKMHTPAGLGGDDKEESDDSGVRDSFDDVASALGIPEDKQDEAFDALKSWVELVAMKCYDSSEATEEDK